MGEPLQRTDSGGVISHPATWSRNPAAVAEGAGAPAAPGEQPSQGESISDLAGPPTSTNARFGTPQTMQLQPRGGLWPMVTAARPRRFSLCRLRHLKRPHDGP